MSSVLTDKQVLGALGESIALKYLVNKGFKLIEKNYRKKFGEIDLIVRKGQKVHFVEVKTVSREDVKEMSVKVVDSFRPEDNLHSWKLKRLSRAIKVYLAEKRYGEETDWQFDAVTVLLDEKNKVAKVNYLEDIIL